MWMVPVGAGGAGSDGELVVVSRARHDRIERAAIGLDRQMDPVPVNGCRLGEIVSEMNDDVIAFAHVESRTRNVPVVGEHLADDARLKRQSGKASGEIHFDRLRPLRDVDEYRRVRRANVVGRGQWSETLARSR